MGQREIERPKWPPVLVWALRGAYIVIGVHGLLLLVGWDAVLSGPTPTAHQCLFLVGCYLVRQLIRRQDDS
ncbi:hypothetical protein [Actinocrispum sp. NPDC049592]|uniref:hypothetical protein n=1 Tax=Actinocrispum sp. NPDC049592 TaxID=3154835 RepID=UPI003424CB51